MVGWPGGKKGLDAVKRHSETVLNIRFNVWCSSRNITNCENMARYWEWFPLSLIWFLFDAFKRAPRRKPFGFSTLRLVAVEALCDLRNDMSRLDRASVFHCWRSRLPTVRRLFLVYWEEIVHLEIRYEGKAKRPMSYLLVFFSEALRAAYWVAETLLWDTGYKLSHFIVESENLDPLTTCSLLYCRVSRIPRSPIYCIAFMSLYIHSNHQHCIICSSQ